MQRGNLPPPLSAGIQVWWYYWRTVTNADGPVLAHACALQASSPKHRSRMRYPSSIRVTVSGESRPSEATHCTATSSPRSRVSRVRPRMRASCQFLELTQPLRFGTLRPTPPAPCDLHSSKIGGTRLTDIAAHALERRDGAVFSCTPAQEPEQHDRRAMKERHRVPPPLNAAKPPHR